MDAFTYGYNIGSTNEHELLRLRDSAARYSWLQYEPILTASEETVKVLARVLNSDPIACARVLTLDARLQERRKDLEKRHGKL